MLYNSLGADKTHSLSKSRLETGTKTKTVLTRTEARPKKLQVTQFNTNLKTLETEILIKSVMEVYCLSIFRICPDTNRA